MTTAFIATLKKTSTPPQEGRIYSCQNCYRPSLKSDFVAFVSRGEAYCKSCTKEA